MDVQRLEAYMDLITDLLICPPGEEDNVLQVRAEWVDEELLMVMEQFADHLEEQGNSDAVWLRQYAAKLMLSLKEDAGSSQKNSDDAVAFMVEIIRFIEQVEGNHSPIYDFFQVNILRLNEALLLALPDAFWMLIQQDNPFFIAQIFTIFGDVIQQFQLGSGMLNLEMGIEAYKQVLEIRTRTDFPEDWALINNNLAAAYFERIHGERADNIEQAILCYEQVLEVRTRATFPEDWARTQSYLARAYSERIHGERADNIERAIECYEQVLEVYIHDAFPVVWAQIQTHLIGLYSARIRGEWAENTELAILAAKQALQVYTHDTFPFLWAQVQNHLMILYSARIRGDKAENIEQAIGAAKQALQVITHDISPKIWAGLQQQLAISYSNRIRGERAENLELAIASYALALNVYTRDTFSEDWATTRYNLANTYKKRIRGERADNLERAIECYEQALQVYTYDAFPEPWALTQFQLADAYLFRIRGERADNIEQAIFICMLQVEKVYNLQASPENWAATQTLLATAFSQRTRGERAENIEVAIRCHKLALQVQTVTSKDWALTQHNLGLAYSERILGERMDNIEEAIASYKQALQVYTREEFPEDWARTQHNLAVTYSERIRGRRVENIQWAIEFYEQALQVRTCEAFPKDHRETAHSLGYIHFQEKSWIEAVDLFETANDAAEALYRDSISYAGKGDQLQPAADISRKLAYAQTQLGNHQDAILALERSRVRGLSENLSRDHSNFPQLNILSPNLYAEYQNITQQLRNLERNDRVHTIKNDDDDDNEIRNRIIATDHNCIPENLITTITKLRKELENTIDQIRQIPGYENFLTPTQWSDITIALRSENPLVYVVTTFHGSVAIVVTPDKTEAIWSEFTDSKFGELFYTWIFSCYNAPNDRETWHNTIESTTRDLWDPLVGPIVQHLKSKGYDRATLIPTGFLTFFPLHAAWTEDPDRPTGKRYAIDDIHFTYTPNALSLTEARKIADRPFTDSILAIDDPSHGLPDIQTLHNSKREIDCAIDSFSDRTVLRHDNATIDAVKAKLKEFSIVHFSCHGTANLDDPLNSGLLMSDGLLTLKDFFALNRAENNQGIRLAILSACETGIPGRDNVDEVVSLPIGLLQAGVAGVISSLWSVSDLSTMLLLTKFYELWRDQKLPPDQALRQAQIWLRDTTTEQMIEALEAALPEFNTRQLSETTARFLHDELSYKPNGRLFAHPFHWAAFSYNGV